MSTYPPAATPDPYSQQPPSYQPPPAGMGGPMPRAAADTSMTRWFQSQTAA